VAPNAVLKQLKPGDVLLTTPKARSATSRVIRWLLGSPVNHTVYVGKGRKLIHIDSKGVKTDTFRNFTDKNYYAAVQMPYSEKERKAVAKYLEGLAKKKVRYGGENYPAIGVSHLTRGWVKLPTTKAPVCSTVPAGVKELNKKIDFKRMSPMGYAEKGKVIHVDRELGDMNVDAARIRSLSAVSLGTAATVGTVAAALSAAEKRDHKKKLEAKLGLTKEGKLSLFRKAPRGTVIRTTPEGYTDFKSFSKTVKKLLEPGDIILTGSRPKQVPVITMSKLERFFGGSPVSHTEIYTGKFHRGGTKGKGLRDFFAHKPQVAEQSLKNVRKYLEYPSDVKVTDFMLVKMPYTKQQRKEIMKDLSRKTKEMRGKPVKFGYENTPQLILHHAFGVKLPITKNRVCSTFLADCAPAAKALGGKKKLTHILPIDYTSIGKVVATTEGMKITDNVQSRLRSMATTGGTVAGATVAVGGALKGVKIISDKKKEGQEH